jgi:pyruvate/2-oxoglutarate dehydrogenase complex dihydrolipoamide dehydrogenase (E3) component
MVIGGGPAGMETARIASLRGHEVVLYDRGSELGGQLLLAAAPPGKRRLLWIREYLATQLAKQDVKVNLGVDVTLELINSEGPDAVVLATGAIPKEPDYIDTGDERVVSSWDILNGEVEPVAQKVVVIGGNMLGCEVAEFMADQGNLVSVIKMRPGGVMAEDCEPTNRRGLLDSLQECRVNLLSDLKVQGLDEDGVKVAERETGAERTLEAETMERTLEAETIVLALGASPESSLVDDLKKEEIEYYTIGDCRQPKNIRQAIYEGALVGRQL